MSGPRMGNMGPMNGNRRPNVSRMNYHENRQNSYQEHRQSYQEHRQSSYEGRQHDNRPHMHDLRQHDHRPMTFSRSHDSRSYESRQQSVAHNNVPPHTQHDELIRYIYDSWSKVELDRGSNNVVYYQELENHQLKDFRPFDLEAFWGRRMHQNHHQQQQPPQQMS
ncbi:uncharacterized protein [Euwallacea similis]|uniref:uncharacterized protein isoform X1 n=1 Tax=Euwallacea similis TaxID=1736056 RepID=UPI00344B8A63